jgi:RNA polymerase sigma factor (sigma-70 family)
MGYLWSFSSLRTESNTHHLILESIKNGDKAQLESLYKSHKLEFINWVTGKYSCSSEEAKDAFQYAIITLYENLRNNKISKLDSSIKTYLFAIGKNKILEEYKSSIRFSRKPDDEVPDLPDINKWDNEVYEDSLLLVENCLDKLGEPCKTLLQLYYYHGMSMDEIADRMKYRNRMTSKNIKYKCILRLRKIYYEEIKTSKF